MKIANHIYQLTGHITGVNSNTYAIDTDDGLVLIDTGYQEYYVETMKKMLALWGLQDKKLSAVFLTHAHFDHAGNAAVFEQQGIPVYASEKDADAVESGGDRVMEAVFGSKFNVCHHVNRVKDLQEFHFGNITLQVIDLPGHTAGSVGYLYDDGTQRVLFTGDMFIIGGTSPNDEIELEIGYTGSVDYDPQANLASFQKLPSLQADIVAGGHRGVYYGDCEKLFMQLKELAEREIQL